MCIKYSVNCIADQNIVFERKQNRVEVPTRQHIYLKASIGSPLEKEYTYV